MGQWSSYILLEECKIVQPILKSVEQCIIKLYIYLPYGPVISLLDIYPKEMKTYFTHRIESVYESIIHNSPKLGNNPNV